MHKLSLAYEVVRRVEAVAAREPVKRVATLRLEAGRWPGSRCRHCVLPWWPSCRAPACKARNFCVTALVLGCRH